LSFAIVTGLRKGEGTAGFCGKHLAFCLTLPAFNPKFAPENTCPPL
jgi:hypothetical protein